MSKILTKTVKKTTLWSVILAVILAAAVVVGCLFGFNKSVTVKDARIMTVTVGETYIDDSIRSEIKKECNDVFDDLGMDVLYKMNSSSGETEIVYVFKKSVKVEKLAAAEDALQKIFNDRSNTEGDKLEIKDITVTSFENMDVKVHVEKNYLLRGIIAGVIFAVLAFLYVSLRFKWSMGILTALSAVLSMALTVALTLVTRIPVTSAAGAVVALSGLVSTVMVMLTFGKIRFKDKAGETTEQSAEDVIVSSVPEKEILTLGACGAVSLLVVGIIATSVVRWYAVLSLIGLIAATFIGFIFIPSLYLPVRAKMAGKANKYVSYKGAKKTSTKIKKLFSKKAAVEETPVEEIPVEEPVETTEEIAEEPVEETADATVETEESEDEAVEEKTEESVEERAEEISEDEKAE